LLSFLVPIDEQLLPNPGEKRIHWVAGGGICGPGNDAFDGLGLKGTTLFFQPFRDHRNPRIEQRAMRAASVRDELQDHESDLMVPKIALGKQSRVSRQTSFQTNANLRLQLGTLSDEIPSMPREEFERLVTFTPRRFDESEAIDRSTVNGDQIVVVGLGVAMLGHSIMLRGEGMDESCFDVRTPEGALNDVMISSRHLDAGNQVLDGLPFDRFLDRENHHLEIAATMFNERGRNKNFAVEVAEHPLGSIFGTVDTDDPEVFRANGLHARLNHT
jgi:hypothetical protein